MTSLMKQYSQLIVSAKAKDGRRKYDGVHAEHHVFAKCLSKARGDPADNRPSNLVLLTHQEHLEAHRLLHLLYPGNSDLAYSYYRMSHVQGAAVDAEAYATASALAKAASSKRWAGLSNPGCRLEQRAINSARMSSEANPKKRPKERLAQSKRWSESNPNNVQATCPHCSKTGSRPGLLRWHFDNCLARLCNAGLTRKQIKARVMASINNH